MNNKPHIIKGERYADNRGELSFINDLDLKDIRRFYMIRHPDMKVVRAWRGHRSETKYFMCISGAFEIRLVKVDNWYDPSGELDVLGFRLSEDRTEVLVVPPGFANGFKATNPGSQLMVFSDKTLEESKTDDFRFNPDLWYNWNMI